MRAERFACGVACCICSWAKVLLLSSAEILSVIQCDFQFKLKPLLSNLPLSAIISPTCFLLYKNLVKAASVSWGPAVGSGSVWPDGLNVQSLSPRVGSSASLVWSSWRNLVRVYLSSLDGNARGSLPGCLQGFCVFEKPAALATGLSVHSCGKI